MSYQTAKRVKLSKKKGLFSGGFVDNTTNIDMAPQYSPYLRNARLDGQSITIAPWYQLLSTLASWSYPKWIWTYLQSNPANDRLIVRHNKTSTEKLYTIAEDWTATAITTGANITSDNRMTFQNVGNVVYCMNWVDNFGKLSGTTYTVPSTGIWSFAPAFSVVFNSSHFASGRPTNPNKVYKSVWDNYEDFNSTGSDQFTFGENVTALAVAQQSLFYFTKSTISVTWSSDITDTAWTISYLTRPLEVKEWSVNNASVVATGNELFYLTPSNAICKIARGQNIYGFEVNPLSNRPYSGIGRILSSLDPDQSDSFGYFLPDKNLIKWHMKTPWATFNDIVIIYDTTKDAFLVDSDKYFYDWISFKGKNYTISMIEPKVYRDEYGQTNDIAPIQFEYRTKEFFVSDPTLRKILRESRTYLDINELAVVTQNILLDWIQKDSKTIWLAEYIASWWVSWIWWVWEESVGEFAIWEDGDEDWIITDESDYVSTYILRTKGNLNKKFNRMQFIRTCSSLAGKVRLKNLETLVEVLNWLATPLT